MKINDYNVYNLVAISKLKPKFWKLLIQNFMLLCIDFGIITLIWLIFLRSVPSPLNFYTIMGVVGVKFAMEAVIPNILSYQANKKISKIVTELEKTGIKTSRLKLQRAKTFSTVRKIEQSDVTFLEKETTVVFRDYEGQLKALQQVRNKVLSGALSSSSSIYVDYSCIIDDSETAKQLLLKGQKSRK